MKHVEIYTDGACSGNPGKGGYGAVLKYGGYRKELSEGFLLTTNNRMELLGVITALKALKEPCHVTLYSDSKYVIDALSLGWAKKWKENGWKRNKSDMAVNPDLWDTLLAETDKHDMEYVWVKGHAGNSENERCDALAVSAAGGDNLKEDKGYITAEQQSFE